MSVFFKKFRKEASKKSLDIKSPSVTSSHLPMALEKRIVFDAAAVSTVSEVVDEAAMEVITHEAETATQNATSKSEALFQALGARTVQIEQENTPAANEFSHDTEMTTRLGENGEFETSETAITALGSAGILSGAGSMGPGAQASFPITECIVDPSDFLESGPITECVLIPDPELVSLDVSPDEIDKPADLAPVDPVPEGLVEPSDSELEARIKNGGLNLQEKVKQVEELGETIITTNKALIEDLAAPVDPAPEGLIGVSEKFAPIDPVPEELKEIISLPGEATKAISVKALELNDLTLSNLPTELEEMTRTMVIVDESANVGEQFISMIDNGIEVITISEDVDGIQEIASKLAGKESLTAVHIISSGGEESLVLGNSSLNSTTLQTETYTTEFSQISASLSNEAEFSVYGSSFLADNGSLFATRLLADAIGSKA